MNHTDAFHQLRAQLQHFAPLTEAEWSELAAALYIRQIPRKEYLVQIGEYSKSLGVVLYGSLRQYYEKDGEERTTYFYFENMLLGGYVSCLTGQKSMLAIQALEDSAVCCFAYSDWVQLCDKYHSFQKIACKIAEYLAIGLETRMVELLMLSPEERYLSLLHSTKKRILERIPQHFIASYLGITPVSLSRIRNRVMKLEAGH